MSGGDVKPKHSMAYRMFLAAARKHAKARAALDKASVESHALWGTLSEQERKTWLRTTMDGTPCPH